MKAQLNPNAVTNYNFDFDVVGHGKVCVTSVGNIPLEQDSITRVDKTEIGTGVFNPVDVDVQFPLSERDSLEFFKTWHEDCQDLSRRSRFGSSKGVSPNSQKNIIYQKYPQSEKPGEPPIGIELKNCWIKSADFFPESAVDNTEEAVGTVTICVNDAEFLF